MNSTMLAIRQHQVDAMLRQYEGVVMEETGHQQTLIRIFEKEKLIEPLLGRVHSVPNGGGKLPPATAGRLKGEGLRSGVFDLNLDVPRGGFHGLKVELKRPSSKGIPAGVPSPDQLDWQGFYRDHGYKAEICYGWRAAYDVIKGYLAL